MLTFLNGLSAGYSDPVDVDDTSAGDTQSVVAGVSSGAEATNQKPADEKAHECHRSEKCTTPHSCFKGLIWPKL